MAKDTFFITTAIDYTNSAPHIGHAYEKLLADVIARYQRAKARKVYFLTGVDQHGQKVQQSAEKEGVDPGTFADENAKKFLALWQQLGIEFDGWAATTHPQHKAVVQAILQKMHDKGRLYKATHRGFYSVRQEQFLTDKERNEAGEFGPEWGEVTEYEEENWYFRLSDHVPWLKHFVERNPDFVFPPFRRKELMNTLNNSEAVDLCITRPKSRISWGIEIPFDPDFVTFVWFDALINYISFAGYLSDQVGSQIEGLPEFSRLWPADVHLIGKDIMTPSHAIYWPIMLHAMGFPDEAMPKLVVHGFWNDKRGQKVSKSEGNIIDPRTRAERFGTDALRYYLMASIATGQDADFNDDRIVTAYDKDLKNDLGNLLNRSLNMATRYRGNVLNRESSYDDELNREVRGLFARIPAAVDKHMETYQVQLALEAIWSGITLCNQYIDRCAPWKLSKDDTQSERLDSVLYHLAESLTHLAIQIAPVMPSISRRILEQLRFPLPDGFTLADLKWGLLPNGHTLGPAEHLFPKLEDD